MLFMIVNACGIWLILTFYTICSYLSCFLFYHLSIIFFISSSITRFFLNTCKGFSFWQFSFNVLNNWKNLLFFKQKLVQEKRFNCWNITWLDIYLAILFLLSSCYSLLLFNQNQCLLIYKYLLYPSQVYDKQIKNHFIVVICVYCITSCSEMFLSQDFPLFYGLYQKTFSCCRTCFSNFGKHQQF